MSKFKVVNLIDKLFVSISIFLICYAWVNFYIRSLWTTFFISLFLTACLVFILYHFLTKKNERKRTSAKENAEINKNWLVFKLLPQKERVDFLKTVLEKNYSCELHDNILTYKKDDKFHLVIFASQFDVLKQNDLLNLLADFVFSKVDVIDIVCSDAQSLNTKIFKDKEINIINKQKLYDIFKSANLFPKIDNLNLEANKIKFKDIVKGMFSSNKARSYFLCGLVLIFSSIILPYHVYYLIFGSMLLLFAVICKIMPLLTKD